MGGTERNPVTYNCFGSIGWARLRARIVWSHTLGSLARSQEQCSTPELEQALDTLREGQSTNWTLAPGSLPTRDQNREKEQREGLE